MLFYLFILKSHIVAVISSVFTTADQCRVSVPLMTVNVKTEPKLESVSDRLFVRLLTVSVFEVFSRCQSQEPVTPLNQWTG